MKNFLLLALSLCFSTILWGKCGIDITGYYIDYKDDTQLTYHIEAEIWTNSRTSIWDFGDGIIDTVEYEEGTRFHKAIHRYQWPGIYEVVALTCENERKELVLVVEANQFIPTCEDSYEHEVEILEKNNELTLSLKHPLYDQTAWLVEDTYYFGESLNRTVYYPEPLPIMISSRDENGYFLCRDEVLLDFEVNFHADFEYKFAKYVSAINLDNLSWGQDYLSFWDFGDGETSTRKYPSHGYQDVGVFNTCLTIQDTTLQQTASKCQEISIDCIGDFSFELDSEYPNIVEFHYPSTGLGLTPNFIFSNGMTIKPDRTKFTHTFTDTRQDIEVCADSPLDSCPEVYCHTIEFPIREQCEAKFEAKLIGDGEAYFIQNLSTSSNDNTTYTWEKVHNPYFYGSDYVIYKTKDNNYDYVSLVLTTSENCYSQYSKLLYHSYLEEESQKPAACFTVTETSPNTYHFKNYTPDENTTFHWDFGDGHTNTQRDVLYHYHSEGFYQVCLTASKAYSHDMLSQQFCEWVNIGNIDTCAARFAPMKSYSSGDQELSIRCHNLSYPEKEDSLTTYQWDFGDGYTSTDFNPVHHYEDADTFDICLKVITPNHCESQYCREIMAGCTEDISITYYPNNDILVASDQSVHFGKINSYYWRVNGKSLQTGGVKGFTIYDFSQKYDLDSFEVCLSYNNRETDCQFFCKTLDFYTDINTHPTSNGENPLSFSVVPNPFNESLQIEVKEITAPLQIKILDLSGKIIYFNDTPANQQFTLQTTSWQAGLYFLQVITPDGIRSERILKMK